MPRADSRGSSTSDPGASQPDTSQPPPLRGPDPPPGETGSRGFTLGVSSRLRRVVPRFLEAVVLLLMAVLAGIVVVGVLFRKLGGALVWYDEVASILLAWLTYYGAALAALRRAHIGVPTVVQRLVGRWRVLTVLLAETAVIGFFVAVAWAGWQVLLVLGGTTLVSLPWVPATLAQSVIPIGAILFIVAELLSVPEALRVPEAPGAHRASRAVEAPGAHRRNDAAEAPGAEP